MVNYQNSKIYKLVSNVTTDVYYGSTCCRLSDRLSAHSIAYKRYLNGKGGRYTCFKLFAAGPVQIVLVESWPCNSKNELHARERHWIENNACVNKNLPGATNGNQTAYQASYRQAHRAALNARQKDRITCSICGKTTNRMHATNHKKSRDCKATQALLHFIYS